MKHPGLEERLIIPRKLSEEQMRKAIEQARKNGRIAEARHKKNMKILGLPYHPPRQNYK